MTTHCVIDNEYCQVPIVTSDQCGYASFLESFSNPPAPPIWPCYLQAARNPGVSHVLEYDWLKGVLRVRQPTRAEIGPVIQADPEGSRSPSGSLCTLDPETTAKRN